MVAFVQVRIVYVYVRPFGQTRHRLPSIKLWPLRPGSVNDVIDKAAFVDYILYRTNGNTYAALQYVRCNEGRI